MENHTLSISDENTAQVITKLTSLTKEINPEQADIQDSITLCAAVSLYEKTKNEELKKVLLEKSEEFVKAEHTEITNLENMEYTSPLTLLFTAYKLTGDEKFKEKILICEKSESYSGMAFDMLYETNFGGKERYHALTVKFAELSSHKNETEMGKAAFMMALIDTIEAIDQPVYELYRALVDLYRNEAMPVLKSLTDTAAKTLFAHSLLKACNMKVLLAEKYEQTAVKMLEEYEGEDSLLYLSYADRI